MTKYLILKQIIPSPATQSISDGKLENIQREVEYDTIEPNNTSPSPANTVDPRKAPICIYSEECSNLDKVKQSLSRS